MENSSDWTTRSVTEDEALIESADAVAADKNEASEIRCEPGTSLYRKKVTAIVDKITPKTIEKATQYAHPPHCHALLLKKPNASS